MGNLQNIFARPQKMTLKQMNEKMFSSSPDERNAHFSEIPLLTYHVRSPKRQNRLWESRDSGILLVGVQAGWAPVEGNLATSNKTWCAFTLDPAILQLGA